MYYIVGSFIDEPGKIEMVESKDEGLKFLQEQLNGGKEIFFVVVDPCDQENFKIAQIFEAKQTKHEGHESFIVLRDRNIEYLRSVSPKLNFIAVSKDGLQRTLQGVIEKWHERAISLA